VPLSGRVDDEGVLPIVAFVVVSLQLTASSAEQREGVVASP
jgi:hypothetical protein